MVAILEKGEYNTDFHPMVDFIAASPLRYALTVKPTVFVSYIRQFWSTARIETTDEGTQILATVDCIQRTVSESSLRRNLKLRDENGISSLPDMELFENLTLMGYNISQNQKFTFQKGQFSHQWKYLIHTIMQCLSPKSTGFNEFSSNIATTLVCLPTNRTYNFSKMIFDGMVKNVHNKISKFLMYPRVEENLHIEFLENKAIEKGAGPNWLFDINSLTKSMNYVPMDADILGVESSPDEAIGVEADVNNKETTITASPTPTLRIHKPIGTKWVLKNKKDKRGIVVKNKARLVAQGHTQEERIDYDEVFAHVARIEAIRLFLAYASFMGFTVYQMDVKSAFLYGTIDEEVYVMQPPGFQDLEF
nr:copia protein [Tanacetum cinerariifolium]